MRADLSLFFYLNCLNYCLALMKAIKRFFRFISLTVLYLGFSCLAGVLGVLLYGITSDFVSENRNLRAPASVQSDPLTEVTNPAPPSGKPSPPQPTTASEVTNKKNLKAFVLNAKTHLEKNYDIALQDFKTQEIWKTKFIYLTVLDLFGNILLSANYPELNGQNGMEWKNVDGKKIIEDMINIGKNGGDFYECRVRHPDEETLQPKIHYITTFKKDEENLLVFSGFFSVKRDL